MRHWRQHFFCKIEKGYFAKLGIRLKYYYSDGWEVRDWWHQERAFAKSKRGKKLQIEKKTPLRNELSGTGDTTIFLQMKEHLFFACDVPFPKIFNTKRSLSMLIRNHPKNYMLCQHIGFQCPLKLEIEKCRWIKGLKMKESQNFIHEHFLIFLQ